MGPYGLRGRIFIRNTIFLFIFLLALVQSLNSQSTKENVCVWATKIVTSPKTNMSMENPPFEDVFPIENRDFPTPNLFSGVFIHVPRVFASTEPCRIHVSIVVLQGRITS